VVLSPIIDETMSVWVTVVDVPVIPDFVPWTTEQTLSLNLTMYDTALGTALQEMSTDFPFEGVAMADTFAGWASLGRP
jgi:hypothetical protein